MSEFRRIMMSSFLMLLLHFPAAAGQLPFFTVRAGDEATLPCIHDQDECGNTTWSYFYSPSTPNVPLIEDGQIHKAAKGNSDRLRVSEKCSLVIKKVTEEDAGVYVCSQFNKSGEQQGEDSRVLLSVVSMTGHQDFDEVMLPCSVKTYGGCRHRVKWLFQGRDVDKDHRYIKTSQYLCSASVTFLTSLFSNTPRSELFTCEVTDKFTGEVHQFPFSPQSSGDATTTGTAGLLRLILVSVGLAALIITVVTVHIWTRAKGGKKQMKKNLEQNDEDEDEDEVNYVNDGGASASV